MISFLFLFKKRFNTITLFFPLSYLALFARDLLTLLAQDPIILGLYLFFEYIPKWVKVNYWTINFALGFLHVSWFLILWALSLSNLIFGLEVMHQTWNMISTEISKSCILAYSDIMVMQIQSSKKPWFWGLGSWTLVCKNPDMFVSSFF